MRVEKVTTATGGYQFFDFLSNHRQYVRLEVGAFKYFPSFIIDYLAVLIYHVVIINEVLADIEVVTLNLDLGIFYGFADHRMLDGRVFVEASPLHEAFDAVDTDAV